MWDDHAGRWTVDQQSTGNNGSDGEAKNGNENREGHRASKCFYVKTKALGLPCGVRSHWPGWDLGFALYACKVGQVVS